MSGLSSMRLIGGSLTETGSSPESRQSDSLQRESNMKRSEYLKLFEEGLRKRGFITEASRAEIVKELEAHIVDLIARYPDRDEDSLLAELPAPDEMASFMADEMPGKSAASNDEGTEIPIGRSEGGPRDRQPPHGPWGEWRDWSDAEYSRNDGESPENEARSDRHRHGPHSHGPHRPGHQGGQGSGDWQDWEQWRKDWREWKGNWREWRRQWKDQWKHQWKDQWKHEWKNSWSKPWENAWGGAQAKANQARDGFEQRKHHGYAPWEPGFGEMMSAIFNDVFGPGGGTRDQETSGVIDLSLVEDLEVKLSSADLKLYQTDGSELQWKVKLKNAENGDSWQPDYTEEGIRMRADFSGGLRARTTKVSLGIPASLRLLRISGASGDIKAEDLSSGLDIQNLSGEVKLSRCGSFLRVRSTSGDIEIEHAAGPVELSSESGDVEIGSVDGDLRVRTSSGDIDIGEAVGRVVLESVSGEIEIKHSCCNLGGEIHTVSGDIDIRVGDTMNAEFSVRSNGDIDVDSKIGIVYEDREDPKRLRVGVGSGGETVVAESTSGDIKIRA